MMRRFFLSILTLAFLAVSVQTAQAQTTWNLQAGSGDGSVLIQVDQFGVYYDYLYNPIGALPPTTTSMGPDHANFYVRVGAGPGARTALSWFSTTASTPLTGVPLTSCTGTFSYGGMNWKLDQSVAPLLVPPSMVQDGMTLKQVYTITNPTAAVINFDIEHYVHPHLGTLSGTDHGGGYKAGPPESMFIYDYYKDPRSIGMETMIAGGTAPATDRYEMGDYFTGTLWPGSGTPLTNKVQGDANSDGLIDTMLHATFSQRRVLTLAAGATTTVTVTTTFGGATYITAPPVAPPKKPPATKLPDGDFAGSMGPTLPFSSGEGTFGNGGRGFGWSQSPMLAAPSKSGPNGMRVLNVSYSQSTGNGSGSSSNTGAALAVGAALILGAGLVLAAKKSAILG